jgi:plasmid stabilization system protein ParE
LSFSVYFHPAAVEEAEAAHAWYEARSHRAAERFLTALAAVIERISSSPQQFPNFHAGTKRALLHRFPFLVVFRQRLDKIEIIAVAHGRRRPGYWRKRMKE